MSENEKFVVCPDCEGRGSHGPGFVWTESDMAEVDPEEFAEMQRDLRAGQYDERCDFCKGQRVVPAVDEFGTPAEERYHDECNYRAEVAAEMRMGC